MSGAYGFDKPADLRTLVPVPEFHTTDEQKQAARRLVTARYGADSDLLDMLGVTA